MTTGRTITMGLAAIALAIAAACAPPKAESQALKDGRTSPIPTTAPTNDGPPPDVADAGISLPAEGAASPVPSIKAISPASALAGGVAPTIAIAGANFVPRTIVEVDGKKVPSSFVKDTEVRATLPASIMATTGAHAITVYTSAPGGGRGAPATFTVANPVPTVADLAPNAALASAPDATVTVTGSRFVSGAKVTLAGADLATTFVDPTKLTVVIPTSHLGVAGSAPLVVVNPAPGGGPSTALSFTVANPTVTVASIDPASAVVGSPATTISATGTGFVAASVVSFNGAAVPTHVQSATSLTADVPASALTTIGNLPVIVTNPSPGGGVSLPVTFVVGNPSPAIATLTPSSATAGDPPSTLTIDGSGFVASSLVTFDGAPSATTFVSATEVTATLTAAQLATGGTIAVAVTNPAPGGGTSASATFTVNNPTPAITSLAPASIGAGSNDTTITVYGTRLVAGATVNADGDPLATTFVSATQLHATVPASKLAAAGSIALTVTNPSPGSSTSGAQTLTVTAPTGTGGADAGATCDPTGVDLVLPAAGTTRSVALDYVHGPALRFAYNPDEPTFFTCPVGQLSVSSSSYAAIVVQNGTGSSAFLEANAACGLNDDAFLAVYPGASTVPVADADREACTGYVANGSSGGLGLASTESNGASYCPGLTIANGGAVSIPPCGKAVLLVQPYDVAQFGEPATLDVVLTP